MSRSLEQLMLSVNFFNGGIPEEITDYGNLTWVDLSFNRLSGFFPERICELDNLEVLIVSGNNLSGSIPSNLSNLVTLLRFVANQNHLSGSIPTGITRYVKNLDLSFNNLSGVIPPDLLSYPNSQMVDLSCNSLEGLIPNDISSSLVRLSLGSNSLSGVIPAASFAKLERLAYLELKNNSFTGMIPEQLGSCQNLKLLNLAQNKLKGSLPLLLGNLPYLRVMELQLNKLSGEIPAEFSKLQMLSILNISWNSLTGPIPSSILKLENLTILNLQGNNLSGSIPNSIANMGSLLELQLGENQLSGVIPMMPPKLQIALNLSSNLFTGSIPSILSRLSGLEVLDISNNKFTGEIPEFFTLMPSLTQLILSNNQLTGIIPKFAAYVSVNVSGNLGLVNATSLEPRRKKSVTVALFIALAAAALPLTIVIVTIIVLSIRRCFYRVKDEHLQSGEDVPSPYNVIQENPHPKIEGLLANLLIYWYQKRMSRMKNTSTPSLKYQFLRVSYPQLFKATDGFTEANMLGLGSYGTVYKGILDQGGIAVAVAVKVLNLHRRGASRSFLSECQALRTTRHRNLLKVLSVCSSVDSQGNDFKALVYEFMPNGSLDKWLHPCHDDEEDLQQERPKSLKLMERLNIAIDIASAMEYLHNGCQSTIVHGDLKPTNVLLDEDITAHVGDFGLAKIISTLSGEVTPYLSSSIAIKGSIGYVAPECGMTHQVSTERDVYSYGILLLEMFTGKRPTDNSFKDGVNFHICVERCLPNRVMEIVDRSIFLEENGTGRITNCVVNVLRIGVLCSEESPRDRMEMGEIILELKAIKDNYERTRRAVQ